MFRRFTYLCLIYVVLTSLAFAQSEVEKYPFKGESTFFELLPTTVPQSEKLKALYASGDRSKAIELLASYFKDKAKERFFFNWENLPFRLKEYQSLYPTAIKNHTKNAQDHTNSFHADTPWKLPFVNAAGETMNAYAVRHLYRQHKAGDLAFTYFLSDQNQYLDYFIAHVKSLNQAYSEGNIEFIADGNGGYEAFRAGNRVENWVLAYHLFLGSKEYKDEDQVTFIRSMLHHAEVLYHTNQKFQFGNHQTKGMVALAVIAMLYPEFDQDQQYFKHAIALLGQHLDLEINKDGFQFERSFHYHVGDIDNYFRVLKLAQITGSPLPNEWVEKLKSMFSAMKAIVLPNKMAPVIQDDTDMPMASFNELATSMALGYVLFEDPEFGYLASHYPSEEYYWLLSQSDLLRLREKTEKKISMKSTALTSTGYYVFREGWNEDDLYMLISAGLSAEKPDHQHGDMLGFQLYANGKMLMPNYQVRYPYSEFQFFKNSWVKNVALVDSIPQGQNWTGNQGGSGFGKFRSLPNPKVLLWEPKGKIQVFRGLHDGYEGNQVAYERTVYFFSGDFFLVRDRFSGSEAHVYYQNFQGNYSVEEGPFMVRNNQEDGSGLDILQLGNKINQVRTAGNKGKNRITYQSISSRDFEFVSILRPYKKYADRLLIENPNEPFQVGGWSLSREHLEADNYAFDSEYIFKKDKEIFLLGLTKLVWEGNSYSSQDPVDMILSINDSGLEIKSLEPVKIELKGAGKNVVINSLQTISIKSK